jgi:type IV secretion system protein TrbG
MTSALNPIGPRLARRFAILLLATACSSSTPRPRSPAPEFLLASPIVEHGPPVVLSSSAVEAGVDEENVVTADDDDGDAPERAPTPSESGAALRPTERAPVQRRPSTPSAVIAQANASASQAPDADGYLNAVMSYTYVPGAIFRVYTAPNNVTDLILEPGEQLMGEPAAGDTLRWRLGVSTAAIAGAPQTHIFIKPTRPGLSTNLTLNTDRRTYFIKLESIDGDCMVAVQWTYPQAQPLAPVGAPPASPASPAATTATADAAALNFDYAVEVTKGRPAWKPRAVYDDGVHTFIRFDQSLLHREAPALFVIERGEMQIVNYRVKESLYIVDRLFDVAELRLGQDEQDVVQLRNRRAPRPKGPPQSQTGRTPNSARPGTPR